MIAKAFCDHCMVPVLGYSGCTSDELPGLLFCSWACMVQEKHSRLEPVEVSHARVVVEASDMEPTCPHDLSRVFPNRKVMAEDVHRSRASSWNRIINGRWGTVQIHGPGMLFVECRKNMRFKRPLLELSGTRLFRETDGERPNWTTFLVPIEHAAKVAKILSL